MNQIGWIAGPDGAVAKYVPPTPPALSEEVRLEAYALGLKRLADFFHEIGFQCNTFTHGTTSISFEKNGVMFDVSVREPKRIAYVTSHAGYEYQKIAAGLTPNVRTPKGILVGGQVLYKPTATVKMLGEQIKSAQVIQVIFTEGASNVPVYIELPANVPDPQTYVICNVLGVMRMLAAVHPNLGHVFKTYLEKGPVTTPEKSNVQRALDGLAGDDLAA